MRNLFLFTAAASVLALAACGTAGTRSANPLEAEARGAISGMTAEFQSGQAEDFFGRFDHKDFSGYEAFRERTREFLLRNHQLTVDIIVDTVLAEGGEVSVSAHWNRSFTDEQGNHKLEEGRCEFIFRRRASGGLALLAIRGNSPF
ncbi:MAG: hypothetical protein Q7R35_04885 [Elusimicrobiota bacterium]|nr:hypothetical protein [Elusimicrobiota bacterium]